MKKGGDHLQFIHFYEECKNPLFAYLMHRLNFNKTVAEDILMDIVLKAYEKFAQFDSEKGSFKNWIFGIAHNHLINFWRDRKDLSSLEALEELGIMPALTQPDQHELEQSLDHEHIQTILLKLSCQERSILTLRFLDELEIVEIASALKKKKAAIRTQLCRALKHFGLFYQKFYPQQTK